MKLPTFPLGPQGLRTLLLSFLAMSFLAMTPIQDAQAESVAFHIKIPRRLKDGRAFKKALTKLIRMQMVNNGFRPTRRVRKGFIFRFHVSVEESGGEDEAPKCAILLTQKIYYIPKPGAKWFVGDASASGRAGYNRPAKLTKKQLRALRKTAVSYAVRPLLQEARRIVRKIKAKIRKLPKGGVVGKVISKGRRYRGRGGGKRRKKKAGKVVYKRFSHLKMISAGIEGKHDRPTPKKK